jgi:PadR family transcriptional regulator, regulatory protein AphA
MSLRYAILTLLSESEMSGYDLVKAFDRGVTFVWPATQSQIYPELKAMENEGLIEGREIPQHDRPAKRVFTPTDTGHRGLRDWLMQPTDPPLPRDAFPIRAWNLLSLPVEDALAIVDAQRTRLTERLDQLRAIADHLDRASDDGRASGARIAAEVGLRVLGGYADWCDWAEARVRAASAVPAR